MVLTVNVDKYKKLIKLAKGRGYEETAFRVPLTDLEQVKVWLTSEGYDFVHLDPINNLGYSGRAIEIDYQRLLVEWRG